MPLCKRCGETTAKPDERGFCQNPVLCDLHLAGDRIRRLRAAQVTLANIVRRVGATCMQCGRPYGSGHACGPSHAVVDAYLEGAESGV